MAKFKGKYRIESNRWQFWDYSAPANYFISICILHRECILGDIINGKMILSEYGNIVETEIKKIQEYHKRILLDEWVVMPNHIHCIIKLGDYGFDNGISLIGDNGMGNDNVEKIHEFSLQPIQPQPTTDEIKQYRKKRRKMIIPKILGKFQQQTSKQINILRNTPGTKNWQRDYHDHVIRNDAEYKRIKYYIINNPKKWNDDKFNVQNSKENSVKKIHEFSQKT